jgi:hypothetical protein
MKFSALLKYELRICLPWLLLCILAFTVFGSILMKGILLNQSNYINQGYYENYGSYFFTPYGPISGFGPLILMTSLTLGIILAIAQFFLPGLFKTWPFTLHRSIKPKMILWSKIAAATVAFIISLGLMWTVFYAYAAVPGRLYLPVFFKTYLEGWIHILAGLIVYFGTALSSVSTAHIYTTRMLGLAVATGAIFLVLLQTSITFAVLWAAAGAGVLILQLFDTFLSREY